MDRDILLGRMRRSSFFMIGAALVLIIILLAIFAPYIATHDPTQNALRERFQPPGTSGHLLGTDQMGRDMFSRVLVGARTSLSIAAIVVATTLVIGTVLGLLAGYYGGWVDIVIMRICDVVLALPGMILGIAVMSIFGRSMFNLLMVLIVSGWVTYCRLVRNKVLVIKNMEFVSAAKVLGVPEWRILLKEIFPNLTTILIVQASTSFGGVILTESALSFLSLGVQPPDPSWGNMIAGGRDYLAMQPWVVLVPGVALMITIFAFNFLGDGLRDVLDVKRV